MSLQKPRAAQVPGLGSPALLEHSAVSLMSCLKSSHTEVVNSMNLGCKDRRSYGRCKLSFLEVAGFVCPLWDMNLLHSNWWHSMFVHELGVTGASHPWKTGHWCLRQTHRNRHPASATLCHISPLLPSEWGSWHLPISHGVVVHLNLLISYTFCYLGNLGF